MDRAQHDTAHLPQTGVGADQQQQQTAHLPQTGTPGAGDGADQQQQQTAHLPQTGTPGINIGGADQQQQQTAHLPQTGLPGGSSAGPDTDTATASPAPEPSPPPTSTLTLLSTLPSSSAEPGTTVLHAANASGVPTATDVVAASAARAAPSAGAVAGAALGSTALLVGLVALFLMLRRRRARRTRDRPSAMLSPTSPAHRRSGSLGLGAVERKPHAHAHNRSVGSSRSASPTALGHGDDDALELKVAGAQPGSVDSKHTLSDAPDFFFAEKLVHDDDDRVVAAPLRVTNRTSKSTVGASPPVSPAPAMPSPPAHTPAHDSLPVLPPLDFSSRRTSARSSLGGTDAPGRDELSPRARTRSQPHAGGGASQPSSPDSERQPRRVAVRASGAPPPPRPARSRSRGPARRVRDGSTTPSSPPTSPPTSPPVPGSTASSPGSGGGCGSILALASAPPMQLALPPHARRAASRDGGYDSAASGSSARGTAAASRPASVARTPSQARRVRKKAVPRYSGDLSSAPGTPALSPAPPPAVSASPSDSSALGLAGDDGGPVHYLIPDMPMPQPR